MFEVSSTVNELVTIRSFDLRWQADICKMRLSQHDIESYLAGDCFAGVNWFWAIAGGGIKVQVADRDAERARAVLGEADIPAVDSRARIRLYAIVILAISVPVFGLPRLLSVITELLSAIP